MTWKKAQVLWMPQKMPCWSSTWEHVPSSDGPKLDVTRPRRVHTSRWSHQRCGMDQIPTYTAPGVGAGGGGSLQAFWKTALRVLRERKPAFSVYGRMPV